MELPDDIDLEIRQLVEILNTIPNLNTTCSCCGHNKEPIRIWFDILPEKINFTLFYFFNNLDPKIWSIKLSTVDPILNGKYVSCYLESCRMIDDMMIEIEKLILSIKKIRFKYQCLRKDI